MIHNIALSCGHLNNLDIVNSKCNTCLKTINSEDKIIISINKIKILKLQNNINDEKIKLLEESLYILEKTIINYNNKLIHKKQDYEFISKKIGRAHV